MKNTQSLISYELNTLNNNLQKSGDPLGFKKVYWTDWSKDQDLKKPGTVLFFTGRMYQMLPFIQQTTQIIPKIKPLISNKAARSLLSLGNNLAGESIIRLKAYYNQDFKARCTNILKGICITLKSYSEDFGYLLEEEPYSGVLLYDLGLIQQVLSHIDYVSSLFHSYGLKKIITVDPHSTFMLKKVYPEFSKETMPEIINYTEILAEKDLNIPKQNKAHLPEDLVIHDPCYMSRELEIIHSTRTILDKLQLTYKESPNNKKDTACCGGPVEYAFPRLSQNIAGSRVAELKKISKNILVSCPICYLNFIQQEKEQDVQIWDLGELLYTIFAN